MPTTDYLNRFIIVCPVGAKQTAIVTWFVNNLGINSVPTDLGPGLSPTGVAPSTHVWMNGAFTNAEGKLIAIKLCQLAAVTPPTAAQWDNATQAQKITWWNSVRAAILSGFGVWCQLADNDGVWDDAVAVLSARGLQVIGVGP